MFFGAQKNLLIEMVLFSTHNMCFGCEIRKMIFNYALLSRSLNIKEKTKFFGERSGSVVECLTRNRRAAGSSLTGVTAFVLEQDTFILA